MSLIFRLTITVSLNISIFTLMCVSVNAKVLLFSHFNDSTKAQLSANGAINARFKCKPGSVCIGAGYPYANSMPAVGGLDLKQGGSVCYPSAGNIYPDEGTFAFWFKLKSKYVKGPKIQRLFNTCTGPNKNDTWKNTMIMSWGGWNNQICCTLIGPDGKGKSVAYDTAGWQPDTRWHRIAFSWSESQKRISLFIDGRLVSCKENVKNFPDKLPAYIVIGARNRWHEYASHSYDELIILDHAINELEASADFNRKYEYTPTYSFSSSKYIKPIPLGEAACTPFQDEVAADQQGGWTDQGPKTDRRDMPHGKVKLLGMPFYIGKKCIALANSARDYFPTKKTITVKGRWDGFLFVQCGAWVMSPGKICGYYDINYKDGSKKSIPIITRENIADWVEVDDIAHARTVLHGKGGFRGKSGAFLYYGKNPNREKTVKSITFRSTVQEALPILIALSGVKYRSGMTQTLTHLTCIQKDKQGHFNELSKTYNANVAKLDNYEEALEKLIPSGNQLKSFYGREAQRLITEAHLYINEIKRNKSDITNAIKAHNFQMEINIEKHIGYLAYLPPMITRIKDYLAKADKAEIMQPLLPASLPKIAMNAPDSTRADMVLNGQWEIIENADPDALKGTWKPAIIPGNINHKFRYAGLRRKIIIPKNWKNKKLRVCFGCAPYIAEIYINRDFAGRHIGMEPFEVDISDKAVPGRENELMVFITSKVLLSNKERKGYSYPCGPKWTFGIHQDVIIKSMPKVSVDFPYAWLSQDNKLNFWGKISGTNDFSGYSLTVEFANPKHNESFGPFELAPEKNGKFRCQTVWSNPLLWGIGGTYGKPNLFNVTYKLLHKGKIIDIHTFRTGFTKFIVQKKLNFALNGKRIFLQGDHYWVSEGHEGATSRAFMMRYFKILRNANFNITRDHHIGAGNIYNCALNVADELGFMLEPEAISGGAPKLIKSRNYSDPVYRENLKTYHQGMARKLRTHPAVVIYSGSNEIFQVIDPLIDQTAQIYVEMEKAFSQVAPHIMITQQGSNWRKEFRTADVHYSMGKAFKDWKNTGKRPGIHGEYNYMQGYYFNMQHADPAIAEKAMKATAAAYRERIAFEKANGLAGTMPFPAFYMMGFCSASRKLMGPFADLITKDKFKTSKSWYLPHMADIRVFPAWPALSGRGRRVQSLRAGSQAENLNFWDSKRVEYTPNNVYFVFKESFYKMPSLKKTMTPEVIVTTTNKKLPVWMEGPGMTCPEAVLPDTSGRAWFHLPSTGEYKFTSNTQTKSVKAKNFPLNQQPGYNYIQNIRMD